MTGWRAHLLGGRMWPLLSAALLAVAVVTAGGVAIGLRDGQDTPPWRGTSAACRQDPMAHVHHPTRLHLLARCATVAGTVRHVALDTSYSDLKIVVVPDADYRRYLRPENDGAFVADVIATDLVRVPAPEVGSRVVASGAWVLDRASDKVALHPTYRIRITSGHVRSRGIPGRTELLPKLGELDLTMRVPDTVAIGEPMHVPIRARWVKEGRRSPAAKVHLFVELTDADGTGVWWGSSRTNALGATTVHMLALQVPGRYTFTVYATPSGRVTTAAVQLRVTGAGHPKGTEG